MSGLFAEYSKRGLRIYKGSCFRATSICCLTSFTMVLLLDKLATRRHAIVADHPLPIPPAFLQDLFLDTAEWKKHLHSLEKYLAERAEGEVNCREILAPEADARSLAVRFADGDADLRKVRDDILAECARQQEQTKARVRQKVERVRELDQEIATNRCCCRFYQRKDGRQGRRLSKLQNCAKCYAQDRRTTEVRTHFLGFNNSTAPVENCPPMKSSYRI